MELSPNGVYRVRSQEDPTAVIALDVKVEGEMLTWFDTSRDRAHRIKARRDEPGAAVFETETGFVYRFVPLTKEIYDREVRPLVELSPEFATTDELVRFYRKNFLGRE